MLIRKKDMVKIIWESLKKTSLREQPLYTCFEYWLGHKAIHAAPQSLNLKRIELVRGQTADEGLFVIFWGVLCKELPYFHC